jgi:hypothetical protein
MIQRHYLIEEKGQPRAMNRVRTQTVTLELRQSDIADFQKNGFADCCDALLGESEIETAIQRSLELFGYGLFVLEPNKMFVTHMTCLEMMLMESYERGLVSKLARRAACLIEPKKANRIDVVRLAELLYDVRSGIVHRGLVFEEILHYEWYLIELIHRVAVKLAQSGFETFKELKEHTDKEMGRRQLGLRKAIANSLRNAADRIGATL